MPDVQPLVLNHHRDPVPEDAVWIMRPGRWGNPFIVGVHGSRDEVIEWYRRHLWGLVRGGELPLEDLAALHGRPLVCCCRPASCHGDVLAAAAEWAHGQLSR